jgi:hypothetical protein
VSNLFKHLTTLRHTIKQLMKNESGCYRAAYRVVDIEQDEDGEYFVVVQIIGKSISYKAKPEKLLADNKIVNLFSPVDIRNLTYLGYLGINAPKYKILAKQLSQDATQTLFAIHKKGEKGHKIVTANEISTNEELLHGLNQNDAHMVGFTTATEQREVERREVEKLKKQLIEEQA